MPAKKISDSLFLHYFSICNGNLNKARRLADLSSPSARRYAKRLGVFVSSKESHGETTRSTKSRLYTTWQNMKRRCSNINAHDYGRYGGERHCCVRGVERKLLCI